MSEKEGYRGQRKQACVVLVTGASGFLGQHVIGLLQTRANHVTEIRALDVVDYVNELDYSERLPVKQYTGSINDTNLVLKACKGVHCVMHIAGIVDARMFQNRKFLEEVNVNGTETILQACTKQNVRRFIYCSTVDVILGHQDIVDGTEDTVQKPESLLLEHYAATKCKAEEMVLKANNATMQTVSIRPPTMYGEGDRHAITVALKVAKKSGKYFHLYPGDTRHQKTYGGNTAWMFICAEKTMSESDTKSTQSSSSVRAIGGNAFFATDDTPIQNFTQSVKPFYEACGIKPFPFGLPLNIIILIMHLVYYMCLVVRLVYDINISVGIPAFRYMKLNMNYKYEKATKLLGYTPLYSYEEAMKRSLVFYKTI